MKKTTMKKFLAVGLLGASFAAHAEGFYVGGDIGMIHNYPDTTNDIVNGLMAQGAVFASATQYVASPGGVVHAGQWVNNNFGWEIGFNDLGSVDGSFSSSRGNGTYKYSATAAHAAVLGGITVGSRSKFFGKAGFFSASTKGEWQAFGAASSKTLSSTGLLLGVGYELAFNSKLSGRVGATVFNGVKFWNVWSGKTESSSLLQVGVGLNYTF